MAVLLILKAFAVSFVTLGEQMLPSAPQDLPNHPDSEVRIYAAAFDNVAWQDSFGVPSGYATAPAFAAFNKAGNVIGVANTVSSIEPTRIPCFILSYQDADKAPRIGTPTMIWRF